MGALGTEAPIRQAERPGREPTPSAICLESPSGKTPERAFA